MTELSPPQALHPDVVADAWLDTRISSLHLRTQAGYQPADNEIILCTDSQGVLHQEGLKTVRDLCIVGIAAVSELPLSTKQMYKEIKPAINDNPLGLKWQDQPSMHEITELSASLGQIPGYVLTRRDLLRHFATNRIRSFRRSPMTGMNLQAILQETADEPLDPRIQHFFRSDERREVKQITSNSGIHLAAITFAGMYAVEKASA